MKLLTLVLIVFLVTFIIVFTFLISYTYYPLAVVPDYQLIMKYLPKTYVMRSDPPLKLIVKVDRKQGFVCIQYWYYWNHDGFELKDDYEPIFVYVKPSGEIHALAFRVHYNWRIKFEPIVEDSHVVITFLTSYHTPINNYPPLNVSEYFIEFSLPPSLDEVPEDINPWDIVSIEGYPTLQQLIRSIILSLGVSILVTLGTLFVYANIRLLRD